MSLVDGIGSKSAPQLVCESNAHMGFGECNVDYNCALKIVFTEHLFLKYVWSGDPAPPCVALLKVAAPVLTDRCTLARLLELRRATHW